MFQTNDCFSLTVTFCMRFYHFHINIDLIGRFNLFLTLTNIKKNDVHCRIQYHFFIERTLRDKERWQNLQHQKKQEKPGDRVLNMILHVSL